MCALYINRTFLFFKHWTLFLLLFFQVAVWFQISIKVKEVRIRWMLRSVIHPSVHLFQSRTSRQTCNFCGHLRVAVIRMSSSFLCHWVVKSTLKTSFKTDHDPGTLAKRILQNRPSRGKKSLLKKARVCESLAREKHLWYWPVSWFHFICKTSFSDTEFVARWICEITPGTLIGPFSNPPVTSSLATGWSCIMTSLTRRDAKCSTVECKWVETDWDSKIK